MPKEELADIVVTKALHLADCGDPRVETKALKLLCDIAGAEAPKRLEHSGPNNTPVQVDTNPLKEMTPAALRQVLEDIRKAKHAKGTNTPEEGAPQGPADPDLPNLPLPEQG